MLQGFARTYKGEGPHFEVWFGKADLASRRSFWFRYATLDGTLVEASTWALFWDRDHLMGGREVFDIDQVEPKLDSAGEQPPPTLAFQTPHASLSQRTAHGRAEHISWRLRWYDSNRRFHYVPPRLAELGVTGTTFNSTFLDVRFVGDIRVGQERFSVDGVPGMLAHVEGRKVLAKRWVWAHCNAFDERQDAVFEARSIHLNVPGGRLRPITAGVLILGDQRYEFRSFARMMTSRSRFKRDRWTFRLREDDVNLTGEITSRPSAQALIETHDTDGTPLWSYLSPDARLTLRLETPDGHVHKLTSTHRAAYEYTTRNVPNEPVDLA